MTRQNHKNDLRVTLTLTAGGEGVGLPEWDFDVQFLTIPSGKRFLCTRRGDQYTACEPNEDGTLVCFLENHGLPPGRLCVELTEYIPDTDFADGTRKRVSVTALDAYLTESDSDDAATIAAECGVDVQAILDLIAGGGADLSNYYTKEETDTKLSEKYTKPSGGIPATDLASAVQTSLGKADTALQSFTENDPTVPSWAKAESKPSYAYSEISGTPSLATVATSGDYDDLTNKPTIPDISGKQDKRTVQNETIDASYAASFALDATKYHIVGEVEDITVTLPVGVTAVDEFLFTFTCKSANTDLHLPDGIDYGNGLDFDTDKAAGRRFQVSISDGIALYAFVEPASE